MGKCQRFAGNELAWSNGRYVDAGPDQAGFEEDRLKLSLRLTSKLLCIASVLHFKEDNIVVVL